MKPPREIRSAGAPPLTQTLAGSLSGLSVVLAALLARTGLGEASASDASTMLLSLLSLAAFAAGCYALSLRDPPVDDRTSP